MGGRMKGIIKLWILLAVAAVLAGCGQKEELPVPDGYVYLFASGEKDLLAMNYRFHSEDAQGKINELFTMLMQGSGEEGYRAAILPEIKPTSFRLNENGNLICVFPEAYHSLEASDEAMRRTAIVKTLLQLPEVESVEFYIGEEPLLINGTLIGNMTDAYFVLGIETARAQVQTIVYYANREKNKLVPVTVSMEPKGFLSMEHLVLQALLKGPDSEAYAMTVPKGTRVNRVVTKDSICYVDLSAQFYEYIDMPPELTVYSIVNTLAELNNVSRVIFTVDGQTPSPYLDMSLEAVFERNLSLIEE